MVIMGRGSGPEVDIGGSELLHCKTKPLRRERERDSVQCFDCHCQIRAIQNGLGWFLAYWHHLPHTRLGLFGLQRKERSHGSVAQKLVSLQHGAEVWQQGCNQTEETAHDATLAEGVRDTDKG